MSDGRSTHQKINAIEFAVWFLVLLAASIWSWLTPWAAAIDVVTALALFVGYYFWWAKFE